MRTLSIQHVSSPLRAAFTISRGAKTSAETLQVSLSEGGKTGRSECVPYSRYGESVVSVTAQIQGIAEDLETGMTRKDLQHRLPAGAARCAVDCAMWDLEAKTSGTPVWELAGLPKPKPLSTAMTISLASAPEMAAAAKVAPAKILKVKLGGPEDLHRVAAIHAARPDAKLVLDGNEGLDADTFPALVRDAAELGVTLIEQPFPAKSDDGLLRRPGHVAICADESVHQTSDLQALAKKYDAVNIKLDKAGGFTEALRMLHEARTCGLGVMVGCMVAGSLSMAPALLLGQAADLIDLDGPLWLKDDIEHGLTYKDGIVSPPKRELWG
jgi:L-alanine-DL-glutamate epimerase-like enolase superfamily enzyme